MGERAISADLLVAGGTTGGVVAAVRAAREGLTTILACDHRPLGGTLPSLGALETHYGGNRAPLVQEVRERIIGYYRDRYGEGSEQYDACLAGLPMVRFEPHVAKKLIRAMVEAESNLTLLTGHHLAGAESVEVDASSLAPGYASTSAQPLREVRLRDGASGDTVVVEASCFIDATYTGDLAALAGVSYRSGRESTKEYGEPHAGRLFTRWIQGRFPEEAARGALNLKAKATTLGLYSGSSGEGDNRIMAYSYRLCITDDPANRVPPPEPRSYDRTRFLGAALPPEECAGQRYPLHHRFITQTLEQMIENDHLFHGHALPNRKRSWNATNFPGASHDYPEGPEATRKEIDEAHLDHALGLLYFLQNDTAVPEEVREMAREYGLAADEFGDNDHLPEWLYIREGRRIRGRKTFTEHDCITTRSYPRAPIHEDSVAITDFPLDSLACSTERVGSSLADGQFFLQELSRPGQIPYGVLFSDGVPNLLAPGAASATHVAWGTLRQTPTFMHLCESAAVAAALARSQECDPAELELSVLQRRLASHGVMLAFFNDVDMSDRRWWFPALQYFATKGFFPSYDARPDETLDRVTAELWTRAVRDLVDGHHDGEALAATIVRNVDASGGDSEPVDMEELRRMACEAGLDPGSRREPLGAVSSGEGVTRGGACGLLLSAMDAARSGEGGAG